ncbi:hypothetical protein DSOUD_2615 [Desulfuromonas soudanensis]|uniref:Uncharacterized protein n=1 Tax=Desulfuromonas soudanensis TaxID=1603606 RepID=A0A0M5IZG8_9BACT|nr:hypothetical protein [Desulfuromonas soudanensis]ALC17368.1 hypothetical protein DSOUD_2615 [Desulfuromonas soudanensis]
MTVLSGCGGGDDPVIITGPGLVGIDDRPTVELTAPELTVQYTLPGLPGTFTDFILSDQPTDGDIAFDPVLDSFTITQGSFTLLFGIDSASRNRPEYRAFLDFPLDGSTGGPDIPLNADIFSATLTVFVNFVDFAGTVPVLLDLVEYSVAPGGLNSGDYSSAPLAVQTFDIFDSDAGFDVEIDVTALMREAQFLGVNDFQVRFVLGP